MVMRVLVNRTDVNSIFYNKFQTQKLKNSFKSSIDDLK